MTRRQSDRKWSAEVTETSDALDLEEDVFKSRSAKRIAASLKRSAEHSHRPQSQSVPIGDVDADLLYQPRGQKPFGITETRIGSRQDRVAPPVQPCAIGLAAHAKQTSAARGPASGVQRNGEEPELLPTRLLLGF